MALQDRLTYEFGPFLVDPGERLLLRDGQPIHISSKVFETLLVLIQSRGRLVEKSELMTTVWADSFVEESNITVAISVLRRLLGDEGLEHKYIQTVAKRGYRFVADVREVAQPAKIHSLAVLPFRSLTPDSSFDYLKVGLADAIITKLGSTGQIVVRPTTAVLKYEEEFVDPIAVGHKQRVDAILVGHIEILSGRARVTVQLVRVGDGCLQWADSYERDLHELFSLEEEVAQRVAQSLIADPLPKRSRLRLERRSTENSKAYRLYLEGRYFWNKRTAEGLRRSIEYFQQATSEDPGYALAFSGLADSYVLLGSHGVESPLRASPLAKAAALKALELDDTLAEAHTSRGMVYLYYDWNWEKAEEKFERALALNPNYIVAHNWYASNLAAVGRLDEALVEVRRAEQVDPISVGVHIKIGRIFYWSREYKQAIEAYRKVVDLDPQYARAHTRLGMAYAAKGAFGDAIKEFSEAEQLSGADPYLYGLMGYAQALAKNTGTARKMLEKLKQLSGHRYVPAFSTALIYVGLGERDRAFELLRQSYKDRSTYMVFAKIEPLLDPVRSDRRFDLLLRRIGLV